MSKPDPAIPEQQPAASPNPDRARAYVGPQALPPESPYATLETDTIRLAPEIDPRRVPTEPSLARVRSRRGGRWWVVGLAAVALVAVVMAVAPRTSPRPAAVASAVASRPGPAVVESAGAPTSTASALAEPSGVSPQPRPAPQRVRPPRTVEPPRSLF
jgi:hypothetical protein